MSTTTVTSSQFTLNIRDVLRGLLIAVLSPVFTVLLTSLNAGALTFDWKAIGVVALSAALSYIAKNFFTPSQVVLADATKATVQSVKDGATELKVMPK